MHHDLMAHDVVDGFCAGVIILQQDLQVKDDAFIFAVMGNASVKEAVGNEDDVIFFIDPVIIVNGKRKGSGENAHDLIMGVPVIGHVIARTVGIFVIEGDREIKGSLFPAFSVINIFHEQCSL